MIKWSTPLFAFSVICRMHGASIRRRCRSEMKDDDEDADGRNAEDDDDNG